MPSALIWFRNDLRLDDNPALQAALRDGCLPIPVYIHAPEEEGAWAPGAASDAWRARSLQSLASDLAARGSRLHIVRGPTVVALRSLAAQSDAEAVFWNRRYEPAIVKRDAGIARELRQHGLR